MWKYVIIAAIIVLIVFLAPQLLVVFDTRLPMPHGAH
jgi:hypothetical protein